MRNGRVTDLPLLTARCGDQQRNSGAFFKQTAFLPEAVFTQVIPVVTGEHDNCAVGQSMPIECIEHFADLGIHETDACLICLPRLALLQIGHAELGFDLAFKGCVRNVLQIGFEPGDDWHAVGWIQVKPALGGDVGCVRAEKTD